MTTERIQLAGENEYENESNDNKHCDKSGSLEVKI